MKKGSKVLLDKLMTVGGSVMMFVGVSQLLPTWSPYILIIGGLLVVVYGNQIIRKVL